jgi:hypothetical protein
MKRLILLSSTWLTITLGVAHAVPARPLYVPPSIAPIPPTQYADLRGTTWLGKDFVDDYRITFESDGTVTHGYNGKSRRGGSWTQHGNAIYFEVNKKYREFKGSVQGDTLQGDSWNVTGKRWQTRLRRISSTD